MSTRVHNLDNASAKLKNVQVCFFSSTQVCKYFCSISTRVGFLASGSVTSEILLHFSMAIFSRISP